MKKIKPVKGPVFLPNQLQQEPFFDFVSETSKYYNILFELYATTFKWENLPFEIIRDGGELYLEKILCSEGKILFFKDDILNEFLVQTYAGFGLNFYGQPTSFDVVAPNGYHKSLTRDNAVTIYNSPYFTTEINTIQNFAQKLALCDLTAMLNIQTQKLPYLIKCGEGQKLTLVNLFKQLNEFNSKIMVDDTFDENSIKVFPLNSPYVANHILEAKNIWWTEAMKYVGCPVGSVKKERVGEQEQIDTQAESNAMIATRLTSRKMACEQINEKWNLNLDVKIRNDLQNNMSMIVSEDGEIDG